jgi:branched-chain amino acid transport system ATP-binding protein
MSAAIIQIHNLTLQLGQNTILRQLNLSIFNNEVLALIGPNGAGKSSLLQVMSGYLMANTGSIFFNQKNIRGLRPYQIKKLAWARGFQTSSLFNNLTVKEHLIAGFIANSAKPYSCFKSVLQQHDLQQHIHPLLKEFDLLAQQDAYPHQLSYARQRALDLAILCVGQAKVLLLDEPTAGLSKSETQSWIHNFKRLRQNKTVLLVEHDMDLVFAVADRIAVLDQGQIIAIGSATEIQSNDKVQQAYLGQFMKPTSHLAGAE